MTLQTPGKEDDNVETHEADTPEDTSKEVVESTPVVEDTDKPEVRLPDADTYKDERLLRSVPSDGPNLNPMDIKWPHDPSGRSVPLKEAIKELGNIQSQDIQMIIMEVMAIAQPWFAARCESNRKVQKDRNEARERRLQAEKIARAAAELAGKEAEFDTAVKVAKRLKAQVHSFRDLLATVRS